MIYTIDKRESRRISILRALCVIFVIFLHQYAGDLGKTAFIASGTLPSNSILRAVQYIISREITFCAVPLFFMISSVLLYAKEFTWKSNMRKKIKTLILPYFVWISLYIFIYWLGQTFTFTQGYFTNAGRIIKDMDIADFFSAYTGIGGIGLFVNAFWFLRDLILLNLLAIAIKRLIDRAPLLCFVLLTILWNIGTIPNLFILNKQSIVFFSLGYYVVKYGVHMKKIDDCCNVCKVLTVYIITIASAFYFHMQNNALVAAAHSFTVIIGIVLLIKLSGAMCGKQEEKIPEFIKAMAAYSFFIYASHDFVQTVLKKIATKVIVQTDVVQMIEYILMPVITCTVCISTAYILKKILMPVYNILTGSRDYSN